jgi:hypothetical protein
MIKYITEEAEQVQTMLWKIADARFSVRFDFATGYELFVGLKDTYTFRFFENADKPNKFVFGIQNEADETLFIFDDSVEPTRANLLSAYATARRTLLITE